MLASLVQGVHAVLRRAEAAGVPEAFDQQLARLQPSVVVLGKPFWGPFIDVARRADLVVIDADESMYRAALSIAKSRARPSARFRAIVEMQAVRRMEHRDLVRADEVWVSTANERAWVGAWVPESQVRVVPNVVHQPLGKLPEPEPRRPTAVGFVGYFEHAPNEEAALELITEILPRMRKDGIQLPLRLIGRGPTRRMRSAAAHVDGVTITGEVADTGAELRHAGMLVMPIRSGAGSRVKALEAAANGVPIISTPFGVEGLGLAPDEHYLAASSPEEFVTAIARVRDDAALRESLVSGAAVAVAKSNSAATLRDAVGTAVGRCQGTRPEP